MGGPTLKPDLRPELPGSELLWWEEAGQTPDQRVFLFDVTHGGISLPSCQLLEVQHVPEGGCPGLPSCWLLAGAEEEPPFGKPGTLQLPTTPGQPASPSAGLPGSGGHPNPAFLSGWLSFWRASIFSSLSAHEEDLAEG